MSIPKEDIKFDKISELLKKAETDDGTFYSSVYDLELIIGISKGIECIRNGNGMSLEEFNEWSDNAMREIALKNGATLEEYNKAKERIYENKSKIQPKKI